MRRRHFVRHVVEVGGVARRHEDRRRYARLEELRRAPQHRAHGAELVDLLALPVALDVDRREIGDAERRLGHGLPEDAQTFDALLGRVAGDQGAVDGADRDAGHPVGMKIGFGQSLVDARLIGTQRAATLQQEGNPFEGGPRPRSVRRGGRRRRGTHEASPSPQRRSLPCRRRYGNADSEDPL